MQADDSNRLSGGETRQKRSTQTIITVIAVAVIAALAWMLTRDKTPEPEAPAPEPVVAPAVEPAPPPPVPDIPEPESSAMDEAALPAAPTEPPLTLENSDSAIREQLQSAVPPGLPANVLNNANLIERGSAAIDAVRRGQVPGKLLNLPRPAGKFSVQASDGKTVIDPASYRRYDSMVNTITSTPTADLVAAFQRFRPLLESGYGALGYAPDRMDNALIAALDRVLATPEVDGEIVVEPAESVYAFAREDLEGLPELQKLLIRTGPDNLRKLKAFAAELRETLLTP